MQELIGTGTVSAAGSSHTGAAQLRDGEWRQVALLCMSLKDLALLHSDAQRLDIRGYLKEAADQFCTILRDYGAERGAPQEMMGEESLLLTAIFGGDKATGNDVERAVRGALAASSALGDFNRKHSTENIHLEMQVGIHFGWVTRFADGRYESREGALDIARSLAAASPADHILITAEVQLLLASLFHYEGLGAIYLPGHDTPRKAYRVVGANARVQGRWQRSRLLRRSPMVGRARELEILQEVYACAAAREASRSGQVTPPSLVVIKGPEGSGKSRLLHEFLRSTDPFSRGAAVPLIGRASSIHPIPYGLFSELLKNLFGIRRTDALPLRQRKLDAGLVPFSRFEPELQNAAALFRYLLGVGEGERKAAASRFFLVEVCEAFTRLLRAVARFTFEVRGNPLLLFLEDLHDLHHQSRQALATILENLDCSAPLVIFATHLPEYHLPAGLSAAMDLTEEVLSPLPSEAQRRVIDAILDGAQLPEALLSRLIEQAAGNPYYLEELVRGLAQDGILSMSGGEWRVQEAVERIKLPASLRSLLLARADALEKPSRDLLVRASVVGKTIPREVLERIQDALQAPPVDMLLAELEEARLLIRLESAGEPTYVFGTPLLRKVSYGTILEDNRAVLHRIVGLALEQQYEGSLSEQYLELANHFKLGEEAEKAAEYYGRAGEKAQREYANELALSCYTQCVTLCTDPEKCRRMRWRVARVLRLLGRPDDAREVLEALVEETAPPQRGSHAFLAETVLELSRVLRNIGQPREAVDLGVRALDLSWREKDRAGQADALIAIGKHLRLLGQHVPAQTAYGHALAILKALNDPAAIGVVYSNMGRLALDQQDLERARGLFSEALERQIAVGNRWGIALQYGHLGEVAYASGDLAEAQEKIRLCLKQAEPLDITPLIAGCLMYLGAIAARRQDASGLEDIERAIQLTERLQDRPRKVRGHQLKAEALAALGRSAQAEEERKHAQSLEAWAGMGQVQRG